METNALIEQWLKNNNLDKNFDFNVNHFKCVFCGHSIGLMNDEKLIIHKFKCPGNSVTAKSNRTDIKIVDPQSIPTLEEHLRYHIKDIAQLPLYAKGLDRYWNLTIGDLLKNNQ